jgi:hypothetical protein
MREKYIFDSDNLTYVVEKQTLSQVFKRCGKFLCASFVLGGMVWGLSYFNLIPSINSLRLQQESETCISNIHQLDTRFEKIEGFLSEIQSRDDSCYRVLSYMEPLSADKRMASFGGTNKYENLEGYFNTDLFVNYNRKVDILSNKLNLQAQSYELVLRNVQRSEDSLLSIPGIQPVNPMQYRVSSSFGLREHPINHRYIHHDGLDLAAREGSKVYSTGKGVVVSVSNDVRGYGKQVVVDHGYGYKTRYAHLSKFLVHVGDTVSRGTEVGLVGNTGQSTGPHLHYEVIVSGIRRNPDNFFIKDMTAVEYNEMVGTTKMAD